MAELLLINPAKKKRRKKSKRRKTSVKRRRNPMRAIARVNPRKRRTYRKRRRNPIGGMGNLVQGTIMPSAIAAGGALALDIVMGFLPLPDVVQSGPIKHVARGAGAIGLGMIVGMLANARTAKLVTTGALTVTMHGAGRELVSRFMPNLDLGAYEDDDIMDGLGYSGPGYSPLEAYENEDIDALSAYENDDELGQLNLEDDMEYSI